MKCDASNAHKACSKTKGRLRCEQAAIGVSQMFAVQDTFLLTSQQVAILVSGSILLCSWQYVSAALHDCECRSLYSLLQVWAVVGVSLGVGHLARVIARRNVANSVPQVPSYETQRPDTSCSSKGSQCSAVQDDRACKQDAAGSSTRHAQEHANEDEDDVALQKQTAQAEAAAKLAELRANLQQLLSSISNSSDISGSAEALHQIACQLFSSPVNVCVLVDQGGVPVVVSAARSALQALRAQDTQPQQSQQGVAQALLQVSWILLQIAHGPAARQSLLVDQEDSLLLLSLMKAVMNVPNSHADAQDCILRNLCWVLLLLIEEQATAVRDASTASAACSSAIMQAGLVDVLQELITVKHGAGAAWVGAATLAVLVQRNHDHQQHGSHQAGATCLSIVQAVLQPDSLHGLSYVLHHQPKLGDRLQGLVYELLHYLLTYHAAELLQLLVEQQLVGTLAIGLPPRLARLLVCQLLSSRGQQVLAVIEAQFQLDVPLALAQIIPLPVHVKLPCAPGTQQHNLQQEQQQQEGRNAEIEAADEGLQPAQELSAQEAAATAPLHEDIYTDVLACRLLLQHDRLNELFNAFAEELPFVNQQQQQQHDSAQQAPCSSKDTTTIELCVDDIYQLMPPVCDGVVKLCRHLMSHDLELQAVQHMRGDSVEDSQSSSSGSSTNSSVLDAAVSAPDKSGVYSTVMASLAPEQQLPGKATGSVEAANSDGEQGISHLLQLPPLSAAASTRATSKSGEVVFKFGSSQHAVDVARYKQILNSSKIVHSILCRLGKHPQQPVTVFSIPHFTLEANCWVLQCLERWLITGQLQGFSPQQAAKLWIAADFLQVDGLQVACEDLITADAAREVQSLHLALGLCSRHRAGSSRLQRLVAQLLLKALSDAGEAGELRDRLLLLQRLMDQHESVLLPAVLAEVRDRLVAVCMLNVGLDAEACYDVVG